MEPKEKALELVTKLTYAREDGHERFVAKQSAIICVDEMISQWEEIFHAYGIGYMGEAVVRNDIEKTKRLQYLKQVKEEIAKL